MANASGLAKAELHELDDRLEKTTSKKVVVQFNPESLKVSFANQIANQQQGAGDQQQASSRQFVGAGTTKLALQLYFDVNAEFALSQTPETDVRKLTQGIAYFITPKKVRVANQDRYLPPGVRFLWGSFQFDGFMDSMEETLEFFSPDGIPQRASVSIALSQQRITEYSFNPTTGKPGSSNLPGQAPVGSRPLTEAPAGATLQSLAGSADWRQIAQANNIENPRLLQPGQLIDLNVTTGSQ